MPSKLQADDVPLGGLLGFVVHRQRPFENVIVVAGLIQAPPRDDLSLKSVPDTVYLPGCEPQLASLFSYIG